MHTLRSDHRTTTHHGCEVCHRWPKRGIAWSQCLERLPILVLISLDRPVMQRHHESMSVARELLHCVPTRVCSRRPHGCSTLSHGLECMCMHSVGRCMWGKRSPKSQCLGLNACLHAFEIGLASVHAGWPGLSGVGTAGAMIMCTKHAREQHPARDLLAHDLCVAGRCLTWCSSCF